MHIRRHEPRSTPRGVLRAAAAASLLALALLAGLSDGDARAAGPGVERYYPGEGLVLTDPGAYTLKLSGYIQPAVETYDFLGGGPDGANTRFRLRRGRLSLAGSAPRQRVSFRFQLELTGRSETGDESGGLLLDAFVNWRITDTLQLSFGQRSTYTDNRELFMSSDSLQLVERSRLTSLFASIREFGLFLQDRIRLGTSQHYLRPYLVLTNGDGPNVFSGDHGGLKLGGRLDWLPLGLFYSQGQFRGADVARELVPRLVIGVAYSYNWGMSSRRGRESGSILYLNDDDEESLPDYGKL
ncbi:MAG: hypothetical protein KC635_24335, partial [Myxococcales bacterium]|nr:hypothetical protein [Myxococcales bacterium]